MSERVHEQKVKDVSIDDECLYIELLNGLRLTGPLHNSANARKPAELDTRPPAENRLPSMSI